MNETPAQRIYVLLLCAWGWFIGHLPDAQALVVLLTLIVLGYQVGKIVLKGIKSAICIVKRIRGDHGSQV